MPNKTAYIVSYCFQEDRGVPVSDCIHVPTVRSMLVVAVSKEDAKTGARQLVKWKLEEKIKNGEVSSATGNFSISIVPVDKIETFQIDSTPGGVLIRGADIVGHEVAISESEPDSRPN